jgi:hypothetical protein
LFKPKVMMQPVVSVLSHTNPELLAFWTQRFGGEVDTYSVASLRKS